MEKRARSCSVASTHAHTVQLQRTSSSALLCASHQRAKFARPPPRPPPLCQKVRLINTMQRRLHILLSRSPPSRAPRAGPTLRQALLARRKMGRAIARAAQQYRNSLVVCARDSQSRERRRAPSASIQRVSSLARSLELGRRHDWASITRQKARSAPIIIIIICAVASFQPD